jgi:hypothetical protein
MMPEDLHVLALVQRREPGFLAARMTAPHDNVPAAGLSRKRAVARLPVHRDQARTPRVSSPALFRNERKSDLIHASIQTHCRDTQEDGGLARSRSCTRELSGIELLVTLASVMIGESAERLVMPVNSSGAAGLEAALAGFAADNLLPGAAPLRLRAHAASKIFPGLRML